MNILTKISVVVLVLLIVAFCVVVIQMATLTPNYKYLLQTEQEKNALLSQENRLAQVALRRAQMDVGAEKKRADGAEGQLAAVNTDLRRQLEDEKGRSANFQAQLTSLKMTLDKLEADVKSMEDRNVKLVADLNTSRDELNKRTEENRRLGDEVNRQTLNAERFQRESEFLRQQLAQAEEKIAKLEQALAKGGGAVAKAGDGTPVAPVDGPIFGTVTAVKGNIASINIGSAKGVRKGMVATVSHGEKYVCQIQIEDVDVNQAAGVIVKKQLDPVAGDKIEF